MKTTLDAKNRLIFDGDLLIARDGVWLMRSESGDGIVLAPSLMLWDDVGAGPDGVTEVGRVRITITRRMP